MKRHISQLDGLRGIAALMIAVSHSFSVFTIDSVHDIWAQTLFSVSSISAVITRIVLLLTNGDVAIAVFFVMSGFLLGKSLDSTKISFRSLTVFYFNRLFRLYPVFLLVMTLTILYLMTGFRFVKTPFASDWFNSLLAGPFSLKSYIANFLFMSSSLSIVAWTLVVELRVVLFFPILYYLSRHSSRWINLFLIIILVLVGRFFPKPAFLQFLYYFYFGLILPQWQIFFESIHFEKKYSRYIPFIILITALSSHDFIPSSIRQYFVVSLTWFFLGTVCYGQNHTLNKILNHPLSTQLGAVSYPFYLTHFLILYILGTIYLVYLPIAQISKYSVILHLSLALISLAITCVITKFIHIYFEKPFIGYGRKLTKFIKNT